MLLLSDGWKTLKYYDRKTGNINTINFIEIRVDGRARKTDNKRELKIDKNRNYPTIYAQSDKVRLHLYAHNAIISTFGNTKDIEGTPNLYIDHIDRNRLNYSLDNLRFVTPSENNLNRDKTSSCDYYIIYNHIELKINNIYKEKEKDILTLRKEISSSESIIIFSDNLINKYKNNLNHLLTTIKSSKWVNLNDTFSISKDGIIRSFGKRTHNLNKFSLGTGGSEYYRLGNKIPGRSRNIHVLMAETFLNDGKKLDSGLIVDHIDNNKLNNSISNLRIVTPSGNMNNKLTLLKLLKPIKCDYNGKTIYFTGITSCSNITGISYGTIMFRLKRNNNNSRVSKEFSNFRYLTDDEMINKNNIKYIRSKEDLIK